MIERVAFEQLKMHKIFTYAFDLRPHLYEVLENCWFIKEAVLKEHAFFENEFIDVVIHSKRQAEFKLVKMSEDDIDLTYRWATNHAVRRYSLSKNEISFEEHMAWFLNKIKDPNCEYFLFKSENEAIGSVRFDVFTKEKTAMISYLLDESFQGKRLGKLILVRGIEEFKKLRPDIQSVFGWVLKENIPSRKIFLTLNFMETENDSIKTKYVLDI